MVSLIKQIIDACSRALILTHGVNSGQIVDRVWVICFQIECERNTVNAALEVRVAFLYGYTR